MAVLQRKIDNILREWKVKEDKKPIVIKGCRQCGKTFPVRNFAAQNYDNVNITTIIQRHQAAT